MRVICCLDDRNGMLFNGRRQSRDSRLCEDVLELTNGSVLWVDAYTQNLFPAGEQVCVATDILKIACAGEYCFVEKADIILYADQISEFIIYKWNRTYPADVYFPMQLFNVWRLAETKEFAGNSHDKITREVYRK